MRERLLRFARNDRIKPQGRFPVRNEKAQCTNDSIRNDSMQCKRMVRVLWRRR